MGADALNFDSASLKFKLHKLSIDLPMPFRQAALGRRLGIARQLHGIAIAISSSSNTDQQLHVIT